MTLSYLRSASQRAVKRAQKLHKLFLCLAARLVLPKRQKRRGEPSNSFYAAMNQPRQIEHVHWYGSDPRFSFENNTQPLQIVQYGRKEEW